MNIFSFTSLNLSIFFLLCTQAIRNGERASQLMYPYMVSLRVDGRHRCGGAIIDKNYILTAAHCVSDYYPENVRVIAGTSKSNSWFPTMRKVAEIHCHEKYQEETTNSSHKNDIAALKIEKPFEFNERIRKVRLPREDFDACIPSYFTGWGAKEHEFIKPRSKLYYTILLPFFEHLEDCHHTDQEFCARPPEDVSLLAYDSGGPLVQGDTIIGVLSGSDLYPGSYTYFTNVWKYLSFIKSVMQRKTEL